jgi:hypothetical protein
MCRRGSQICCYLCLGVYGCGRGVVVGWRSCGIGLRVRREGKGEEMTEAQEVVGFGAEPCSAENVRDGPLVDCFCPVFPPWDESYQSPGQRAASTQYSAPGYLHLAAARSVVYIVRCGSSKQSE